MLNTDDGRNYRGDFPTSKQWTLHRYLRLPDPNAKVNAIILGVEDGKD